MTKLRMKSCKLFAHEEDNSEQIIGINKQSMADYETALFKQLIKPVIEKVA
jgi:hypothetical protein